MRATSKSLLPRRTQSALRFDDRSRSTTIGRNNQITWQNKRCWCYCRKRVVVVERESCTHGDKRRERGCGLIQMHLSTVPFLLFLGVLVLASLAEKLTLRAPPPPSWSLPGSHGMLSTKPSKRQQRNAKWKGKSVCFLHISMNFLNQVTY